jgi:hypothetical protein
VRSGGLCAVCSPRENPKTHADDSIVVVSIVVTVEVVREGARE